jgi:3-hydroxyisobutyryl-CoA hydrolase
MEGVTSHVINKTAPKWNPERLEDLDLDQDILARYFYSNVKKQLTFWDKPLDYHLHPYRRYGLPSQNEILEVKAQHNLTTVKDTVDWFEKDRNGKFGVRQKVEDVLDRLS